MRSMSDIKTCKDRGADDGLWGRFSLRLA